MNLRQKAKALMAYLQGLPGFTIVEREFYDHVGAIIVDAMLQAGASWAAVERRRDKVRGYEEAKTTSGFLALLERQSSAASFLDWKGRKPQRVLGLARFLKAEGVETTADLRAWIENASNQERILDVEGVGKKTSDYLLKLSGSQSIPIDRYWFQCLDEAGVQYAGYDDAQRIVQLAARMWDIDRSALDTSVWRYFRKSSKSRCL
jgi:endonuclease III-like uncharacterized protein